MGLLAGAPASRGRLEVQQQTPLLLLLRLRTPASLPGQVLQPNANVALSSVWGRACCRALVLVVR